MGSPSRSFHFLTGLGRHHSSPRISPDGENLVFLENDLRTSTTFPVQIPGPSAKSKRLAHVRWTDVLENVLDGTFIGDRRSVIFGGGDPGDSSFDPLEPLPERVFSEDGQIVFASVRRGPSSALLALSPLRPQRALLQAEPGLVLVDVRRGMVLARRDQLGYSSHLLVAPVSSFSRATASTTTTTTTSTTTATADPCEQLYQELVKEGTIKEEEEEEEEEEEPPPTDGEPSHPLPDSLEISTAAFSNITDFSDSSVEVVPVTMHGVRFAGVKERHFSAWYAFPKGSPRRSLPLMVMLKDGPHSALITSPSGGNGLNAAESGT